MPELSNAEIDRYVDEIWDQALEDMRYLIQVDSVEDPAQAAPGMPWGPASRESLDRALALCKRMGFETTDVDGYLGFGDVKGTSEKYLATIAHTDIVPTGKGWSFDPLDLSKKDGFLIGRGIVDDKGPWVLSLYAINFFKRWAEEHNTTLPYTLRCIIGNCEETSMKDIDAYLERYPEPEFCFTPDAEFSVICGEKGIFHGHFSSEPLGAEARIIELDGGTVPNAVPGTASVLLRTERLDRSLWPEDSDKLTFELESAADCCATSEIGLIRITAHGKSGHASIPEGTVNAIAILCDYLLHAQVLSDTERPFIELAYQLASAHDGSQLDLACSDDIFGALTMVAGVIKLDKQARLTQTIDSRYPKCCSGKKLQAACEKLAAEKGAHFSLDHDDAPFYIDPSSPEIQILIDTYAEYSGKRIDAYVIGGGTYARHFKRACAFGPQDPNELVPDWVGTEHAPDEGISEESMKRALKIYIKSIGRLLDLKY